MMMTMLIISQFNYYFQRGWTQVIIKEKTIFSDTFVNNTRPKPEKKTTK